MSSIPKIKLGVQSSKTRSTVNLGHDVHSTFTFGHIQPLVCRLLPGNATVKYANAAIVRFKPLVRPTFGRVKYVTVNRFVNISDIYMPFENFLSGQRYNTSDAQYYPETLPFIRIKDLVSALYPFSSVCTYKRTSAGLYAVTAEVSAQTTFINQYNTLFKTAYQPQWITSDDDEIMIKPDFADQVLFSQDELYMYCVRFNNYALNLRKSFIGCGVQIDPSNTKNISVLPIFAFYKAYYDAYMPQRGPETWTNTYAYKILDIFRVYGQNDLAAVTTHDHETVYNFFYELANTYYTADPDYISAHTEGMYNQMQSTDLDNLGADYAHANGSGAYAEMDDTASGMDALAMKAANRLLTLVNINSVTGGRIAAWLKAVYNIEYIDEHNSDYIGSNSLPCEIGAIMATTEVTSIDQKLGDYAGMGIGRQSLDDTQHFTFKTKSFGYWITLACIVPESDYCQGNDMLNQALTKEQFFNPVYDALGFEMDDVDVVNGQKDVIHTSPSHKPLPFGYVPRFTAWKVAQSKLNGDFNLRSLRGQMLPFTLDRVVTYDDITVRPGSQNPKQFVIGFNDTNIPRASTKYRYIGRFEFLGNYNRIFTSPQAGPDFFVADEDNFIVHNVIDMSVNSDMLSISDSYNSVDDDDHDTIAISMS